MLNVNADAVVKYSAQLERMSRTALPNAVRTTLNSAAFDVKKNTMPAQADKAFIKRKPTFFKATSKVNMAQGTDINTMRSEVGFAGASQAVEDLEKQEKGGAIGGRSFIPLRQARAGSNWNKNVRASFRMAAISNSIVDSKKSKGKTDGERFSRAAIHAGKGGFVIGNRRNSAGNKTLFRIASIKRIKGVNVIKSVPLYSVKSGKKVKPKATHFMETASNLSAGKMEQMFIGHAKKKLNK